MKIANGTAGVRSVDDKVKINGALAAMAATRRLRSRSRAGNSLTGSGSGNPVTKTPRDSASSPAPGVKPAHTTPEPAVAHLRQPKLLKRPRRNEPQRRRKSTYRAGEQDLRILPLTQSIPVKANVGQDLPGIAEAPLASEGRVIVPAGAPATLQIQSVQGAGRIKGSSELGPVQ